MVASCVPAARSLYHYATLAPAAVFTVPLNGGGLRQELPVPASPRMAVALRVTLQDAPAGWELPFSLTVTDADGTPLLTREERLAERAGGEGLSVRQRDSGSSVVERRLPAFAVAADTVLSIGVEPQASAIPPEVERLELLWYRELPRFAVSFFTTLLSWVLGLLLVLGAAIWWLRRLAVQPPVQVAGALDDDARLWGMFCHLTALLGYVLPFGHLIGPLVVWLAKREQVPFADQQGREAINFQLSVTLYTVVALIACFVFIGFLLLFALVVFHVAMTLYAALRAQQGDCVRYPLTLRVIP